MTTQSSLFEKTVQLKRAYRDASLDHWLNYEINQWTWWLSIGLTIIPLIVWWKLVDRKRLLEIVIYGLLINIFASFLDVVGSELVLWDYPVRVLPNIPRLVPIDFAVIPVCFMLIYQWFPGWKKFIIVNGIVAAVFAFGAEPLFVRLNMYLLFSWKYIYSFPIYLAMAIIAKWIVNVFLAKKTK